jgi:hypothetical protein
MTASKFMEAQIAIVLKQAADGTPVDPVSRTGSQRGANQFIKHQRCAEGMNRMRRRGHSELYQDVS